MTKTLLHAIDGNQPKSAGKRKIRQKRMLAALKGRQCIYRERRLICLARVLTAIVDDRGICLHLKILRSADDLAGEVIEASANWEILSITGNGSLHAAWVNWTSIASPLLVQEIESALTRGEPFNKILRMFRNI